MYDVDGRRPCAARRDRAARGPARDRRSPRARSRPTTNSIRPGAPLDRVGDWARGRARSRRRPASTYPTRDRTSMPQWAGSCWYYLRYLDPTNELRSSIREVEHYWMGPRATPAGPSGGVDLYVGGVEHAVLHLLYSRFWHKVLFDLGHVSSTLSRSAACSTRATSRRTPTRTSAGCTSTPTNRGAGDGKSELRRTSGEAGHPRVRQDGQEPEERRVARRHLRRSTAPTRCGSTRCPWVRSTQQARGDPRRHRHVPLPAAALAQHRRRGHRRAARRRRARRRRARAVAAPHDRRGAHRHGCTCSSTPPSPS